MSTRLTSAARTVAAGALAAGLIGALAAPAVAAPLDPAADDYTRSIQLSWDGIEYADRTTENFLGTPVAIPGDSATRMLRVRNDGPTAGTLRATIINVDLLDRDAPDVHHHPAHVAPEGEYAGSGPQGDFYGDLEIDWRAGNVSSTSSVVRGAASMTELADDVQTQILQIPLEPGEEVEITLRYELPVDATSGNRANVADRLASFDVLLELGGDLPVTPTEEDLSATEEDSPLAEPTDSTDSNDESTASADSTDAAGASQTQPSSMPETGADLRWPALAVAVLLAVGGLLLRASRRREVVRGHH